MLVIFRSVHGRSENSLHSNVQQVYFGIKPWLLDGPGEFIHRWVESSNIFIVNLADGWVNQILQFSKIYNYVNCFAIMFLSIHGLIFSLWTARPGTGLIEEISTLQSFSGPCKRIFFRTHYYNCRYICHIIYLFTNMLN